MPGAITAFTNATRSGNLRYGPKKVQNFNYWIPDWVVPQPMPVLWIQEGGTAYKPGTNTLELQAGTFLNELALACSNELGAVVIMQDYSPGGFGRAEAVLADIWKAQDPDRLFFPEILHDAALCGQFVRGIATKASVWGAGKSVSTSDANWARLGTSSGGWMGVHTQLVPDGGFPYGKPVLSGSEWEPRFGHTCKAVIASIPQLVFSAFDKGSAGDGFNFDAYGQYSWMGAYFMDSIHRSDSGTLWGWDQFPMEVKVSADVDELLVPENPRVLDAGYYLLAPNVVGVTIKNITNPADTDPASMLNQYWRGDGVANATGGQPTPINNASAKYLDLHDPWNCYWLFHRLTQLGNTLSKMRAGSANTNPDATTRYGFASGAAAAADVKAWLTGTIGWVTP